MNSVLTLDIFGDEDFAQHAFEQAQPPISSTSENKSLNADDDDDEWQDDDSGEEGSKGQGGEEDEVLEDMKDWSYLNTTIQLRHASLVDYFRNPATVSSPLATAVVDAQIDLAVTCMDALCSEVGDAQFEDKVVLEEYAVSSCFNHLRNVDIDSVSDHQIVRVVEGLVELLLNKVEYVASSLERNSDQSYRGFRPASDPNSPDRDLALKWFRKACNLSLGSDMLRPESAAWIKGITTNPLQLLLPLARQHVLNWFESLGSQDASNALDCAVKAVVTVWINPRPRLGKQQLIFS